MQDRAAPPATVGPARPEVTLRGAPPFPPPVDPERPGRSVAPVLVLLVLAALAVATGVQRPPAVEPGRPGRAAYLELRADHVSVSLTGVLVLPVVMHNPGTRLRVRSAETYAEPVRADTATTAPAVVPAGESRRFVVLLEPDCRFLAAAPSLTFRAGLLVVVDDHAGRTSQLVLDLTGDPSVAAAVTGLCRRP